MAGLPKARPLPPIRRELIAEILRELKKAARKINQLLLEATSDESRRRLLALRAEVARVLEQFRQLATTAALSAADESWEAGLASVAAQVNGVGLAARVNVRQLTATRYLLTHLIADIEAKALARINSAILQQVLGVNSLSETVDAIAKILDVSRRRAMTIAYTEIGRAYSAAQYEAMLNQAKLIPGLKKRWIHSGKVHGRPGHVAAEDYEPIPVAQPFEIVDMRTGEVEQLRFPRDPVASGANTINCGCMMVAVVPPPGDDALAPAP